MFYDKIVGSETAAKNKRPERTPTFPKSCSVNYLMISPSTVPPRPAALLSSVSMCIAGAYLGLTGRFGIEVNVSLSGDNALSDFYLTLGASENAAGCTGYVA